MARNGYKIFDADCHVMEPATELERNIAPAFRDLLSDYATPNMRGYSLNGVLFNRRLGTQELSDGARAQRKNRDALPPREDTNTNPKSRIADMDIEGIDVGMIIPSGVTSFSSVDEVGLEVAVYASYSRYVGEYCSAYPTRLVGVMPVSLRDIETSVQEIERIGKEPWVVGIMPSLPTGLPLDDPSLDPIWAAAASMDLTIALHFFTGSPPYGPGSSLLDNWNNRWLARSAIHPWSGMRNMAALLASGAMDRHPNLRVCVLEAGHGWLPYWLARCDEQAERLPTALQSTVRKVSEYVADGRYFQSMEPHEGEMLTRHVIEAVGPDVLMFATDYPHGESWFPEAVQSSLMSWDSISSESKRKMFWDNCVRCYRRYLDIETSSVK